MKKLITLFVISLAVVVSSCSKFDDSAIWEKFEEQEQILNDHEKRIAALEELCKQINTNINALQTLVEALEKRDYITNVSPVREDGEIIGYTISFANSDTITIYHGKNGKDGVDGTDGKDGYTPQIGVMKDTDGIYYWTLDGEWLLDGKGNKIKAVGTDGKDGKDGADGQDGQDGNNGEGGSEGQDGEDGTDGKDGKDGVDGITPRLKIENDYWYVSYDEGTTWIELGRATGEDGADGSDGIDGSDGDSIFSSVTQDEEYVYFNLADGTMITLPKHDKENIQFEDLQVKAICCKNWDTNNDGELSYAEAAAVTDIGTVFQSNTNVIAFTELEYFISLTTINANAFNGCICLWKIVIPDGVEKIGSYAFEDCKSLYKINIPRSLSHIGSRAFYNCNNLTGVYITDLASFLTVTIDRVSGTYANYEGNPLYYAGNLYLNNEIITDLIIPTSISEVLDGALYGCTSIVSVKLHSNISSIGMYAFGGCSNLSVIYCMAQTPPKIGAYHNQNGYSYYYSFPKDGNYTIYVPQESYDTYKAQSGNYSDVSAGNWSRYKSKIKPYDFENNVEVEL